MVHHPVKEGIVENGVSHLAFANSKIEGEKNLTSLATGSVFSTEKCCR